MRTYTIIVHEGDADEGGFWAEVEELPGCFASGDTLDELEKDVKEAIESYMLSLIASGDPIPDGRGTIEELGLRRWQIPFAVA